MAVDNPEIPAFAWSPAFDQLGRCRRSVFAARFWNQRIGRNRCPHDGHDNDHGHDHTEPPSDITLRVKSLESLLVEKGLVDPTTLDALVDRYEHHVGPQNGKKVVARAWTDPGYRQWLQDDASAAIGDFGFKGRQGEHMVCVENGPKVHNLVVCTLCSCYPWTVLGLPPVWYKSAPYRSRAVADPRGVLAEFGTRLDDDVEIRVWGFDFGNALSGHSRTPRRHRRLVSGTAGAAGHPQFHDRGRTSQITRGTQGSCGMNSGHDLGGMHGLGPINPEPEEKEPVFHADWERKAFSLTLAAALLGRWNIDMGRHSRERQHPARYLLNTYYENWFAGDGASASGIPAWSRLRKSPRASRRPRPLIPSMCRVRTKP